MKASLERLYETTLSLSQRLDMADSDELAALVELRDEVIRNLELKSNITDTEKRMLKEIGELDEAVVFRMIALKEEAAQAINKMSQSRLQKKGYQNAYAAESFFFDTKK
ncbi:hypothetical protein [Paenibacillus sp. NEAU-GSW1]|uniref:hypothetical protein n=1 Tax=Paenibacillus sp. NEAU-GSW1 TaxID=2682486 RepID=UPI0012E0FE62|nr:hypothetical protein [Paenibacillus sp. NEAU-GSW1]MUT65011.1 hypothetical protein [Paenibacillus sp. NEAU-GSW1]